MKTTLLILFLSLFIFPGFTQENLEKLRKMEGTWRIDLSSYESADSSAPPPPDIQVRCAPVSAQNGVYCEVEANDGSGNYQVISSELLAYNESTGKIHLMLFNGPTVSYGMGEFEGDVLKYTDSDVNGVALYDGELHLGNEDLVQVVKMPGGSKEQMRVTYRKVE